MGRDHSKRQGVAPGSCRAGVKTSRESHHVGRGGSMLGTVTVELDANVFMRMVCNQSCSKYRFDMLMFGIVPMSGHSSPPHSR